MQLASLTCDGFRAGRAPLGEELPEAVCAVWLVFSEHLSVNIH